MSDPCKSRWVTPAGSACPPITRCDSLIRQCCQSIDAQTPTTTTVLRVGGLDEKRRGGRERTGRGLWGCTSCIMGLSGHLSKRLCKVFLYRMSAGFGESHLKGIQRDSLAFWTLLLESDECKDTRSATGCSMSTN